LYYAKQPQNKENLAMMKVIDRKYKEDPCYGILRMTAHLNQEGFRVNHKRMRRLIFLMSLMAIYQKPRTSQRNPQHTVYSYLLRNKAIERPNQVWATDITYIPMAHGFVYLVAILDWHSWCVLICWLSSRLDSGFCVEALNEALEVYGPPEIVNTDQGSQFTSQAWIARLQAAGVQLSMDGKGRYLDNIVVERFWRTLEYEDIYLKRYESIRELKAGLSQYIRYCNESRLHQALGCKTPQQVYSTRVGKPF
jgi:putative transposase